MTDKVELRLVDQSLELPMVVGSENERAIDIRALRERTGCVTFDPGYGNTGACESGITFIDGEKGILRYRGYSIEVLAERSTFLETAYLLIFGELPSNGEQDAFRNDIRQHNMLHEQVKRFFDGFPRDAHPMAILASTLMSLSTYHAREQETVEEVSYLNIVKLMAKLPTIAAYAYKKSIGEPFLYPDPERRYAENFLYLMFGRPNHPYEIDPVIVRALDLLLLLHADHEQNCSTSTARMVRSSMSDIFACITSAICALWGQRHGGANQRVVEMLERIRAEGGDVKSFVEAAKGGDESRRLYGFGHRVYKNYDPRARIIKVACDQLLDCLRISDPLLEIAKRLEEVALHDSYFLERKLYPNVDFYSGIMYKAMGIPVKAFPVMFAMGRLPGWIAHCKEFTAVPNAKIGRPRQIYTGPPLREYVPMEER